MKARRIDLDFATRAQRVQPLGVALLGTGIVAAAVGAFVWGEAWSAQSAQASAVAELGSRDAAAASWAARPASASAGELARQKAALRVARGLQTPWSDLLAALEAAPHEHVSLLAIEPSIARQQVRLTAEASDAQAMFDYLAALQADGRLAPVVLLSHQVQQQAPGQPVRFQVQTAWGAAS